MKTFVSALIRALVAAGAPVLLLWALDSRLNPEQGPDIGGGFLLLLALFVIPLAWARFDGRRRGPRVSLVVWMIAAALVFLTDAARMLVTNSGLDASDIGDALFLSVFLTAPFAAGACLGPFSAVQGLGRPGPDQSR